MFEENNLISTTFHIEHFSHLSLEKWELFEFVPDVKLYGSLYWNKSSATTEFLVPQANSSHARYRLVWHGIVERAIKPMDLFRFCTNSIVM